MPTIYDNITEGGKLADGLRQFLRDGKRADFCVGYFNLRGWRELAPSVDQLSGEDGVYCRLLVGMQASPQKLVRWLYSRPEEFKTTNAVAIKHKKEALQEFAKQLVSGQPTNTDEKALQHLARQLGEGKLRVKLYTRHPLHAKLYLAHRADSVAALAGFVGSSNLTFSGLFGNGELNVDVLEQDAAAKLQNWFEDRWDDDFCIDVSKELAEIICQSWARADPVPPYHIYVKTAWHLSREAVEEAGQFRLPANMDKTMLEHQKQAVALAAQRLNSRDGVIVGDVVGLGKTLVATAVAKVFQEDRNDKVLVICPPALEEIWKHHIREYMLSAEVFSLGKAAKLLEQPPYQLVILDESHNLRNRESKRHKQVRDYIHKHNSRVVMLTATPYNKELRDLGSQLLLFNDSESPLGVMPEGYIQELGGVESFKARHPNIDPSSLAAFEKSEDLDDWRELMRLFMVRRTRRHIIQNYAQKDGDGRHYLALPNGDKFYFPRRSPKTLKFAMQTDDPNDQYAKLYASEVVDIICGLKLPRYGYVHFLKKGAEPQNEEEKKAFANISRAGRRLIGFARFSLFKRLESSGHAFLLSVRRHIVRNTMVIAAIKEGALPIGQIFAATMDELDEQQDSQNQAETAAEGGSASDTTLTYESMEDRGKKLLAHIREHGKEDYYWIPADYFKPDLANALRADAQALLEVLARAPKWEAAKDRKLQALRELCESAHKDEKLLVFSESKDTVKYIGGALGGVFGEGFATLDSDDDAKKTLNVIQHFSPNSNGKKISPARQKRVLVTTDKLSEGVNLQDSRIVVNYDLPWALIRLVQRAGRVDRIGQTASEILCYSALPEDGVENILSLRERIKSRIRENEELLGSDELFFEGENPAQQMRDIYGEKANIDEDEGGETDLISFAHDIWRQAIKADPNLQGLIEKMPDVVYSAKRGKGDGVIAFVQDTRKQSVLAEVNNKGEVVSHSQYNLLKKMRCEPQEPPLPRAENHHDLVQKMVDYCRDAQSSMGGQLGGARSPRKIVYDRLMKFCQNNPDHAKLAVLHKICAAVYNWPLKDSAREKFARQLRAKIKDDELANMALAMSLSDNLCQTPKRQDNEDADTKIICSMGLIKGEEA